nr:Hypothetical protein CBG15321 [Haemonchus contortus]
MGTCMVGDRTRLRQQGAWFCLEIANLAVGRSNLAGVQAAGGWVIAAYNYNTMASDSDTPVLGTELNLTQEQVNSYNEALMDYGFYVMSESVPLVLDTSLLTADDKDALSNSSPMCNICVNPLQAIRAWALLSLTAAGKTAKAAKKFLRRLMGGLVSEDELIHGTLRALHALVGERTPPSACLRLFVEHQPAVPVKKDVLAEINFYYGSIKNPRSVFVETGFAGDDDGLASIARINAEVEESTGGRVNFVVREDNGPNRRAQMVLVSASDCTFFWRFDGKRGPLQRCQFYDTSASDIDAMSYIEVWPCEGLFRYSSSDGEQLLELDSYDEGFKLYLYKTKGTKLTTKSFLQAIDTQLGAKSQLKVCVPRPPVMCPLRMSECTNKKKSKYGFCRIFDREKSDLTGIFYRSHSFYPYFITLWEHYHKARFIIESEKPESVDKRPKSAFVGSKLNCTVEQRLLRKKYQKEVAPARCEKLNLYKYYDCEPKDLTVINPHTPQIEPPHLDDTYVRFDMPFFFMVTKEGPFGRIVQCIGRFNNVSAVHRSTGKSGSVDV